MSSIGALVNCGFTGREAKNIAAQIGWCDIDEEWAYASDTTITVPTGAASRFQVGDKIRLTQTTVKYFYVVGVADTVLTVTGGSDYTVANAAISAVAYSRCERPFGFPEYFSYAPYHMGFDTPPVVNARFNLKGLTCRTTYYTAAPGTPSASSSVYRVSAPILPCTTYGTPGYGECMGIDAGVAQDSIAVVDGFVLPGYIQLLKTKASPAWTVGGGGKKYAYFDVSFRIA